MRFLVSSSIRCRDNMGYRVDWSGSDLILSEGM
jgi:hypothetical protein